MIVTPTTYIRYFDENGNFYYGSFSQMLSDRADGFTAIAWADREAIAIGFVRIDGKWHEDPTEITRERSDELKKDLRL